MQPSDLLLPDMTAILPCEVLKVIVSFSDKQTLFSIARTNKILKHLAVEVFAENELKMKETLVRSFLDKFYFSEESTFCIPELSPIIISNRYLEVFKCIKISFENSRDLNEIRTKKQLINIEIAKICKIIIFGDSLKVPKKSLAFLLCKVNLFFLSNLGKNNSDAEIAAYIVSMVDSSFNYDSFVGLSIYLNCL